MKPLIHYYDVIPELVIVGARALIWLPQRGLVSTSAVQKIMDKRPNGPVFETLNTIYAPHVTDESYPVPSYKPGEKKPA